MKSQLVGTLPRFFRSISPITLPDGYLVAMTVWHGVFTLVCAELTPGRAALRLVWERALVELTRRHYLMFKGVAVGMDHPSVTAIGAGRVFVASVTERLIVVAETGELLASARASTPPTCDASLQGETVLVPEGQYLAEYHVQTAQLLRRRPTPQNLWLAGVPAFGLVALSDEAGETQTLWSYETGRTWTLPSDLAVHGRLVRVGNTVIVPHSGSVDQHLVAFDLAAGRARWNIEFARPEPLFPMSMPPLPIPEPIVEDGGRAIAVTAIPSTVAVTIESGSVAWRADLDAQPTGLRLTPQTLWVTTSRGTVYAIEPRTGVHLGSLGLPESAYPIRTVSSPSTDQGGSEIICITSSGDVYRISQ